MTASLDDDDLTVRLVRNLQTGLKVEASARQLHEKFVHLVANYFRRRGVPPGFIDDHTQETFLRVFRGIGGFREGPEEVFAAWMMQIARNVFKNWLRTAQAQKRHGFEISLVNDPDADSPGVPEGSLADDSPGALHRLTEREEKRALREAIERLSDQRRRACELRYLRGLKYREIAVEMNISIETVKAHLHQARSVLDSALRPAGRKASDPQSEKGEP